jgi:GMP reductase
MQKAQYLSYQDVFLKPQYSKYHSRSEADVSVELGNRKFRMPVIPANMKCTINQKLALWMSDNDYFYVMLIIMTRQIQIIFALLNRQI